MKIKYIVLLAVITVLSVASTQAQITTNTLSFSGASWNDGGSLDGYFTIVYNMTVPQQVLALDVTTGNGTSDGFLGHQYTLNISGQADTVSSATIDATQNGGYAANEVYASSGTYSLFLDWQGSDPTSLYLGNAGGEYSSENYSGSPGIRALNTQGGSVGVPEPPTSAFAGIGFLMFGFMMRLRNAKR